MATERPVLAGHRGGGLGGHMTTPGLRARARLALRLAGGGLLIAAGAIHLDLYLTGYRSIPTIGWLFLLQIIVAFALGVVVLASGEWLGRGRFLPGRSPWPGNRAVPGQSRCGLDDCSRDRGKTAPSPGTNQKTPVPRGHRHGPPGAPALSQNPLYGARIKLAARSTELRFTGGENMQSHPAKIVLADETDAEAVITILSTGFQNDPVSRWLFPDDDARERLHPDFFRPFVQMALEDGEIYTTEDRSGAALWFPVTGHHEDQPGLGELYEPILGADYASRIAAFDERSTANHPDREDHFYLPFIAVRPQFFGRGIGTALMCDRLAALDGQGLPTYLEASNRDSARLYERLGYKRLDRTTDMPGGPSLYPMWRNAA